MKLSNLPAVIAAAGLLIAPVAATAGTRAGASVPAGGVAAIAPVASATERRGAKLGQNEDFAGSFLPFLLILGVFAAVATVVTVTKGNVSPGS